MFYSKFIIFLYTFRALLYSSSGGQVCIIRTASSNIIPVGDRPVHRLGEDPRTPTLCNGRLPTECDDTRCCKIQF